MQSYAIRGGVVPSSTHLHAINGNQMQSTVIRCNPMQSDAIRCHQMPSDAIRCNQMQSEADGAIHGAIKAHMSAVEIKERAACMQSRRT